MKNIKTIKLAPMVLALSLVSCSGLTTKEVKQRVEEYDAAAITEKYSQAEVSTKVDIKKRTGAYAENGALEIFVSSIEDSDTSAAPIKYQSLAMTNNCMIKAESIDELEAYVKAKLRTVAYYPYDETGLKIVAKTNSTQEDLSFKQTTTATSTTYVLGDGRYEKVEEHGIVTASGSLKGTFEFAITSMVKWTAK